MTKTLPLRQCLGIDVSKDHLQVCISNLESDQRIRLIASTKFDNNGKGLNQLLTWVKKHRVTELGFKVILEATGVYHEQATYFFTRKRV